MFLTSFYMLDMIYQLKLKLAVSEINISSLENKLKLIELKTSLLQNKEVLSVNTIPEYNSLLTLNGFLVLALVTSVGYLSYSVYNYLVYSVIANSGVIKLCSKIDDGFGYVAESLSSKEAISLPLEIERLDENLPEVFKSSFSTDTIISIESVPQIPVSMYDPSQTPELMVKALESCF